MSIRNPVHTALKAGEDIPPNRIVKIGAADQTVIKATAATDQPVGVSAQTVTALSGQIVDVVTAGVYEVKAGGVINRGGRVTSDGTGQAVAAAPSAGTNNGIIGIALETCASGDLVTVLIDPGTFQG